MAKKAEKCPGCDGTGIDRVKSNPFLKKECQSCMGTGSSHPPVYYFVCDVCEQSRKRLLGEEESSAEMSCHECNLVICKNCQKESGDKRLCPRCDGELFPAIF